MATGYPATVLAQDWNVCVLFRHTEPSDDCAMPELPHLGHGYPDRNAKVRVGRVAGRQRGRVTAAQLRTLGVAKQRVPDWIRTGYLYAELPEVYAVGHDGRSEESDLFAAILYAGPDAALCGMSAALWRGLVKWRTQTAIEVATPRRIRSLPANHAANGLTRAVRVRCERSFDRAQYHGIPTVPIPHIVLDLAATGELQLVRFAIAQLDYIRRLNVAALEKVCGRGTPGSAILRQAIDRPQPLLALARSPFEVELVHACEITNTPLPDELNPKIGPVRPDAVWREQMVVVQCDGEGNHGTWRQRRKDANEDQFLRSLGFYVIRYTYEQVRDPWALHADLMPILEERRGRGARAIA